MAMLKPKLLGSNISLADLLTVPLFTTIKMCWKVSCQGFSVICPTCQFAPALGISVTVAVSSDAWHRLGTATICDTFARVTLCAAGGVLRVESS